MHTIEIGGDERDIPRAMTNVFEWYSRWALQRYEPCESCPPEYRAAYGRLQGLLEAADACFRSAYSVSAELSMAFAELDKPKISGNRDPIIS
ncbi:MAG: hypothetical protein HY517_00825 [Candidatus Aenigmarchaeota archaeon]|nr:hypothetical protein [Candidatus Aenigmarchaeota archaeon]